MQVISVSNHQQYCSDLLRRFDDLRRSGQCCDVQLVACESLTTDGKPSEEEIVHALPCQRCVLAVASPFFRALLCGNMRERDQQVVALFGLTEVALRQIVDFVYTGSTSVSDDFDLIALLTAAAYVQMDNLVEACSRVLDSMISTENCLYIEAAAEACNTCQALAEKARKYAVTNFETVCRTSAFLDLTYRRVVSYLQDYVQHALGAKNSDAVDYGCDAVYKALGNWSLQQPQVLNTLSDHVSGVDASSASVAATPVQLLFTQLLSFSWVDSEPPPPSERPRRLTGSSNSGSHAKTVKPIGIFVVGCGRLPDVWAFSLNRNCWLALPPLPTPVRSSTLIALSGALYAIGGRCSSGDNAVWVPTCAVWRLEVHPASWSLASHRSGTPLASWHACCPMPLPRYGHAAIVVANRYILVVGGNCVPSLLPDHDSSASQPYLPCESIWAYDLVNDQWIDVGKSTALPRIGAKLALMPPSSDSGSGSNSWTMLEMGGLQAGGIVSLIDCYSVTLEPSGKLSVVYSGEQLLLPKPVRYAEPGLIESVSSDGTEGGPLLLVVCSNKHQNGSTASKPSSNCFVLSVDLRRRLCRVVSPNLPTPRGHPAVAVTPDGRRILVAGGTTAEGVHVKTVECFDEASRQWTNLSDMPGPRYGHCATLLMLSIAA